MLTVSVRMSSMLLCDCLCILDLTIILSLQMVILQALPYIRTSHKHKTSSLAITGLIRILFKKNSMIFNCTASPLRASFLNRAAYSSPRRSVFH